LDYSSYRRQIGFAISGAVSYDVDIGVPVHGTSQKADDRPGDCAMMIEKAIDAPDSSSSHRGHPENAAHCLPSMCCFHETFGSAQIVAIGLLLPSSRLIERGTALSSHPLSTQDRPPRHT
jgi:hypothetical protein